MHMVIYCDEFLFNENISKKLKYINKGSCDSIITFSETKAVVLLIYDQISKICPI